jgi:hypothetical protein
MISMIRYYPENIRNFIADEPVGRAVHTGVFNPPDFPQLHKTPDSRPVPPSKAFDSAAPGERRWTDIRPS